MLLLLFLGGGGIDRDGTSVTKLKLLEFRNEIYL